VNQCPREQEGANHSEKGEGGQGCIGRPVLRTTRKKGSAIGYNREYGSHSIQDCTVLGDLAPEESERVIKNINMCLCSMGQIKTVFFSGKEQGQSLRDRSPNATRTT
jgi:hypothetical protein